MENEQTNEISYLKIVASEGRYQTFVWNEETMTGDPAYTDEGTITMSNDNSVIFTSSTDPDTIGNADTGNNGVTWTFKLSENNVLIESGTLSKQQ